MRYEYFGYPKDFLFEYHKGIEAVTRADVLRVAKEHFKPENLAIVAVGNPKEFGKPLTALGKVTPHRSDHSGAQAGNREIRRIDPRTRRRNAAARSASHGRSGKNRGSERYQRIGRARHGPRRRRHENEAAQSLPGAQHFRQEVELPFGKIVTYSDGKTGLQASPQGVMPMPPAVAETGARRIVPESFSHRAG